MKLKARDIVPGWPRSRSIFSWNYYAPLYFPGRRDERFNEDAQAAYEYHQAQQRMVTQFLEERLNRAMLRAGYRPSRYLSWLEKIGSPS